ncbi:Zf-MYND domain protein, putative, partial [Rhizoctonia solani AG-3 Rhs1AP]
MPTFEERLTESFDKYIANEESVFDVPNGLIPLDLLETALAVGENMHKVGFQRGDKVFPVLMSAIREYTKLHKGGIFEHYYGFLCIRHLIRMSEAPRQEVTEALAARALDSMITVLCTENAAVVENLLGILSKSGHAFVIDGGLSYEDVEFLIKTLWKDRKSLRDDCLIQELHLCIYIESFVLNRYRSIPMDYQPVDEDDNRKVTEAYCAVFAPPMELSLAAVIQLDIATMLFRWVLDLLGWESKGPLTGEDLVPHIVKGAMARLTLEVDREWSGPMLEKRRAFTNRYAGEVFGYASLLVINKQIPTPSVQQELVQMLTEFDFYGLAGRVLMLVTRETCETRITILV